MLCEPLLSGFAFSECPVRRAFFIALYSKAAFCVAQSAGKQTPHLLSLLR